MDGIKAIKSFKATMSNQLSAAGLLFIGIVIVSFWLYAPPTHSEQGVSVLDRVDINFSGLRLNRRTRTFDSVGTLTNTSSDSILAPVSLVLKNISPDTVSLANSDGTTADGDPFVDVPVSTDSTLTSGETISNIVLQFNNPSRVGFTFDHDVLGMLEDSAPTNQAPIANAGADFNALTMVPVTLNGSASYDPEGALITYNWMLERFPGGSAAGFSGQSVPNPPFMPDVAGEYEFSLDVYDGEITSVIDRVTVTAFSNFAPPNADAGRDQRARVGESVNLDGTGSSDPNGIAPDFSWTFDVIPPTSGLINLSFPDTANPQFTPDVEGFFDVELLVDNGTLTDDDTVRVTVVEPNTGPNANAGPDQVTTGNVNLDGTASFDPDPGPAALSYAWAFVSIPSGSALTNAGILNAQTATPSFTPDVEGSYVLRVTVSDGDQNDGDNVLVFIDNTPPTIQFTNPTDGAVVESTTPTFNITFSDSGSGVDIASYRTSINGTDVTASTVVTHTGASYTPTSPLPAGDNQASATIGDNVGNVGTTTIRFTVSVFRAIADCSPTNGPPPLTVRYRTRGEYTNGTIVRYRWDFEGDGTFDTNDSVARDYTRTFEQQGSFPAVLEVTNNLGETATDTCPIMVSGNLPVATAEANPSNGGVPLPVTFTGTGSKQGGTIVLHEWDFEGDGVFDFSEGGSSSTGRPQPDAITYFLNHADCGSNDTFNYFLNGVQIGSSTGTVGCVCNSSEPSFTITDSNALANWDPSGVNTLRVDWGSNLFVGYIRAELLTPAGQEDVCIFDAATGGNCANRNLCNALQLGGSASASPGGGTDVSTSTVQHTYSTQGIFNAIYRVTDNEGLTATASATTTAIRTGPPGSPTVQASATPSNGSAPLNVSFDGSATDDGTIVQWEWDFEGDGTFDFSSPTSPATTHTYTNGGIFAAALRATDDNGMSSVDLVEIVVDLVASLSIPNANDTFDPTTGGTVQINTSLTAGVPVRIFLRNQNGTVVRTLVNETRTAGNYSDIWDGRNDAGQLLPQGAYFAVLEYDFGNTVRTVDLTDTTGGTRYSPSRNRFPRTFSPYDDDLLTVNFTIPSSRGASEIQAFVGLFRTDTRFVTLLDRVPLGVGTHTIHWDGLDSNGNFAVAPPGDQFLFGIFGFTLPDNAVFLQSAPVLSNVSVDPNFFDPSTPDFITPDDSIATMTFDLDRQADVELTVTNLTTGRVLRRIRNPNVPVGLGSTIEWNGRADSGLFVDSGDYRLTLRAIDTTGSTSLTRFALVRVFY